ncbi:MAG: hypothetical protein PVJ67_00750 [Candidatus Pacearchaeota archaeon]|jgi:hypothetical protein
MKTPSFDLIIDSIIDDTFDEYINPFCEHATNRTKEFGLCNKKCPYRVQTDEVQSTIQGRKYNLCLSYGKKRLSFNDLGVNNKKVSIESSV